MQRSTAHPHLEMLRVDSAARLRERGALERSAYRHEHGKTRDLSQIPNGSCAAGGTGVAVSRNAEETKGTG